MMDTILSFFRFVFRYREKAVNNIMLYVSLIFALTVVVHVGYITDSKIADYTELAIKYMFYGLFFVESAKTLLSIFVQKKINISHYAGIAVSVFFIIIIIVRNVKLDALSYFANDELMYLGIVFVFLTELSRGSLFFDKLYFNPTILFVISFISLILVGTALLMLPRTTLLNPLSFVDALFMATSAVCITGLSVTDISTNFSVFGQTIIMVLIQVGGLGIMTFTGFFGYFFSGGFSFKNQLMFGEILDEKKLNSVISTLLKIILITLLFEFIGGFFIFITLDSALFSSLGEQIFFSAFHTISSFCNSGFTIVKEGIHTGVYRQNYAFQIVLALVFILGGLGFGVVYNFYTYLKAKVDAFICVVFHKRTFKHKAQVFSFNSRFILTLNILMLLIVTVSYFLLERQHTLEREAGFFERLMTSFFMANSSRSAGFSTVDIGILSMPTLIMITSLMWIGASPGSTGGGVKVTTVAVALMNVVALARGKESIEIFRRKIAPESLNKAFAIIVLSVLMIAFFFVLLNFSDTDKPVKALFFEIVSAYTTNGLSLGITGSLSNAGKIIVIVAMFVGRVGMLTLLVAFIKNTRNKSYIYPTEKLMF